VGITAVDDTEDLIITCKSGITLRTPIANIKESGRATQGVILIRLDADDAIAAISTIQEQVSETEENTTDAENGETNESNIDRTNNPCEEPTNPSPEN
jgi:DNA gyrase subunit A